MQNTIIYLIGFPGTGKLTIAQELCAQSGAKLVDNHLINNPVFSLIRKDNQPIPKEAWNKAEDIRDTVLSTIKTICGPEESFVFTNVLLTEDSGDLKMYKKIEQTAQHRSAHFIPVILTCDLEENKRRVASPARNTHYKMTCPDALQEQYTDKNTPLKMNHPNQLELDTTNLSPQQAAKTILNHPALLKTAPTRE